MERIELDRAKVPFPKCGHQFCAPLHCRFAGTEPVAPDSHDFRDAGDPMEKVHPGAAPSDWDCFGRPLRAGT